MAKKLAQHLVDGDKIQLVQNTAATVDHVVHYPESEKIEVYLKDERVVNAKINQNISLIDE